MPFASFEAVIHTMLPPVELGVEGVELDLLSYSLFRPAEAHR
jgi:hypothetical protein